MEVYPGITMDPGVRFGKPCIKGTRIDVATLYSVDLPPGTRSKTSRKDPWSRSPHRHFPVHRSSRAHDQNRIIGMAHDRLGHTTEHPALDAGAAMRAHCDQRIEGFSRRCDNFVCFETLFSCE